MINLSRFRSSIASVPGDTLAIPRAQLEKLLDEAELGQRARNSLITIRTMVNLAANTSGASA